MAFFGTLLCVLVAMFGVERRVAAYPSHDVAATATAATGVQKPDIIPFDYETRIDATTLLLCVIVAVPVLQARRIAFIDPTPRTPAFLIWAPSPLAVRPPPTL